MNSRANQQSPHETNKQLASRLQQLLQRKECIPYHENIPDKEFPYIFCSIYGAPKTNELFVKLTNGTVAFVEAAKSDVLAPSMANRIFGLDVADHHTAFSLAEHMWEKHKAELITKQRTRKPRP